MFSDLHGSCEGLLANLRHWIRNSHPFSVAIVPSSLLCHHSPTLFARWRTDEWILHASASCCCCTAAVAGAYMLMTSWAAHQRFKGRPLGGLMANLDDAPLEMEEIHGLLAGLHMSSSKQYLIIAFIACRQANNTVLSQTCVMPSCH